MQEQEEVPAVLGTADPYQKPLVDDAPHGKSTPEEAKTKDTIRSIIYDTLRSVLVLLDQLDKAVSEPMFRVQFPFWVEYILSVPGNFFGVPIFSTAVAPSIIAWMATVCTTSLFPPVWWNCLVTAAFLVVVAIWASILKGNRKGAIRFFFGSLVAILSPPFGVMLLSLLPGTNNHNDSSKQLGFFQLAAWCAAVIPIALLKPTCKRPRPVTAKRHEKHLKQICKWLTRDGLRSFPSGDVAGAVAFAYPLWRCNVVPKLVAACFVVLSGMGRMYWQAHHCGDVIAGIVVSIPFCWMLEQLVALGEDESTIREAGCKCSSAQWWHPFAAQVTLSAIVIVNRKLCNVQVFSSGVIQAGRKRQ